MKIGIVSDTHMPKKSKQLPGALIDGLKGVDLIIHAGDWSEISVKETLEEFAPVKGVYGNIDSDEIKEIFQASIIFELNGYKIGITHGHIGKLKLKTYERALEMFHGEELDCIIFGHSHIPFYKKIHNTIVYNPGSPTDKRVQKEYSFGIMTIGDAIKIEHHTYQDKS